MPIRKRESKKALSGFTYQVYFPYKDSLGISREYFKGGFKTKKEAKEHEALKKADIKMYGDIYENNHLTFNLVFEEFMDIEGKVSYAKSTYQYYKATHKQYLKHTIGESSITGLKYRDIQRFINDLDVGVSTAKNIKKVLNKTFAYALKNGYIKENPMHYVKLNKQPNDNENKEVAVISKEQLDQMIEKIIEVDKHAPDFDYTQFNYYSYAVAIFIGWYTGLRVSETFALKKEDFDFENNLITIDRRLEYHGVKKEELYTVGKLKTKKSKAVIPLASKLKEGLKIWFEKNPYDNVICDIHGNYILPQSFNYRVRNICKELGLDFHYHCLRHTFTTNLIVHNVKPNMTKELVRHGDIRTTLNVYTHVKEDDKSKIIESVFDE